MGEERKDPQLICPLMSWSSGAGYDVGCRQEGCAWWVEAEVEGAPPPGTTIGQEPGAKYLHKRWGCAVRILAEQVTGGG